MTASVVLDASAILAVAGASVEAKSSPSIFSSL